MCEESLPEEFAIGTLKKEVMEATKRLGISTENLHLFDYPVRKFNSYRQEILENLVEFGKNYEIDIVFAPSINDIHQDHSVLANEAIRAFKHKTIMAYEMPWNNLSFETSGFFILSEEDVNKKLYALDVYESQKRREYFTPDFIKSLLMVRGAQVKAKYAEAFDVVRFISQT
jgi:LmbE family N-acetylglucosaminyl deacetylase